MQNRACFWKPFGSEPDNESQKHLKSAEKYFYPTFSAFWAKVSEKKIFFLGSETLGLLDNTLTANYEYSSRNRENLQLPIQIKLSEKASSFCEIFFPFFECSQTKGSLESQVFLKLLTLIDCLFNCVTGLVSETRFGVKQLKSLKNSSNLQKSTFILLFHHSELNWVRKSYFWSDLRF